VKEHGPIVIKLKFVSELDNPLERYGRPKFENSAILLLKIAQNGGFFELWMTISFQ
jgi:hypothetical protein